MLAVLGRPVLCAECGRTLFKGLAYLRKGEVRLLGAEEHLVAVSFRWADGLQLRHVELDRCPSPERPWVR